MVTNAEMFIATLEARGLKYTTNDLGNGGVAVGVMFDYIMTHVIFDGRDDGSHVAFRTRLEGCPADKMTDIIVLCNSLNEQYRWVKFYVSTENNIMIEDDAIVSPDTAGEECFELLIRTVSIIKDVKPSFMKIIYS